MKPIEFLTSIVTIINQAIDDKVFKKCSDRFAGTTLHAIAEQATREGIPGAFPVIFDADGNGTYVGVDEVFPSIIYHRIAGPITISPVPNSSVGDRMTQRLIAPMRLAAYADRRRVEMTGDELGLTLFSAIPANILNFPNFGTVTIRVTSIVANNPAAFSNEYNSVMYFLKPEHVLININYQIESNVKPHCFNVCE